MSPRVWRTIPYEGSRGPLNEGVLRFAVVLWCRDPTNGLSDAQVAWLRTRMQGLAPLTHAEHAKLVPRLLAWSAGKGTQAVLVKGLRGVVDDRLLPEEEKEA